jgi:hypothetical protein|tara:strand:- start:1733 stop:1918 length:186 start_codon:yes stop_codon:yes gene_type:complete
MDPLTSKPSCIEDLKELVNNLTDRDVNIKNHINCIKSVLEDKRIKNDATKIKKIKQILKNG